MKILSCIALILALATPAHADPRESAERVQDGLGVALSIAAFGTLVGLYEESSGGFIDFDFGEGFFLGTAISAFFAPWLYDVVTDGDGGVAGGMLGALGGFAAAAVIAPSLEREGGTLGNAWILGVLVAAGAGLGYGLIDPLGSDDGPQTSVQLFDDGAGQQHWGLGMRLRY